MGEGVVAMSQVVMHFVLRAGVVAHAPGAGISVRTAVAVAVRRLNVSLPPLTGSHGHTRTRRLRRC